MTSKATSKHPRTDAYVDKLLAPIGSQGGDRNQEPGNIYMDPQVRFANMADFAGRLEEELNAAKEAV